MWKNTTQLTKSPSLATILFLTSIPHLPHSPNPITMVTSDARLVSYHACQISMLATLVRQISSFTSSTSQFYESNQFRPPFKIQSIREPFSFSVGYGFSRPYHIGLSGGLMENPTYYELLLASKFSFFFFFFFFFFSFAFVLLSCKVGSPFFFYIKKL